MDLFRFFWRELKLSGARVYEAMDFEHAIELAAAGNLPLDRLITNVLPLNRLEEAMRQMERGGDCMKILVSCTDDYMTILDQFKLDGKTALVTGARRGIGKAMAVALAEAGADIVATSAGHGSRRQRDRQRGRRRGPQVWCYACDLADRHAVYAFIARVKAECPPVDILVNNGGTILRKPAAEHPDEYWDKIIEIDLNAQFVLAREFGRDMLERGGGKIIFTASPAEFPGRHHGTRVRRRQRRSRATDQGAGQ